VPFRELVEPLAAAGVKTHLIGGAFEAGELDAKRAIDQGIRLAYQL
jgi:2,4-dienoyl-CoA reductase (NADPH2)